MHRRVAQRHHLGGVLLQVDGELPRLGADQTGRQLHTGGQLPGDHPFAVTTLPGEILRLDTFAAPIGSQQEHLAALREQFRAHDLIIGLELDPQHPGGDQPHRAHVLLREADRHPSGRRQQQIALPLAHQNPAQTIPRVDPHEGERRGRRPRQLFRQRPLHHALARHRDHIPALRQLIFRRQGKQRRQRIAGILERGELMKIHACGGLFTLRQ